MRAPGPVLLDLASPVRASQGGLVDGLDPGLPDLVVRQVALALQRCVGGRVDRTGPSDQLGEQGPVEIVAPGVDGHLDAGQRQAILGDQAGGLLGDVVGDRDGIEPRSACPVDRLRDRRGRQVEQAGEAPDDLWLLAQGKVRRTHGHRERRHVLDEGTLGAIVDEAPCRRHGLGHDLVARHCRRQRRVRLLRRAARELHGKETGRETTEGEGGDQGERDEARGPALVGQGRLEDAHQSTRSASVGELAPTNDDRDGRDQGCGQAGHQPGRNCLRQRLDAGRQPAERAEQEDREDGPERPRAS